MEKIQAKMCTNINMAILTLEIWAILLNLKDMILAITTSNNVRMFVLTEVGVLRLFVPLAALLPLVDEQVFLSKQSAHIQSIRLLRSLLLLLLLLEFLQRVKRRSHENQQVFTKTEPLKDKMTF